MTSLSPQATVRLHDFAVNLTKLARRPVTFDEMRDMHRRCPVMLQVKTETLVSHIRDIAEGLGLPAAAVVQLIVDEPDIARCKPATLLSNVKDAARRLGVPLHTYQRIALKERFLLRANPKTISANVTNTANFLGYDKKALIRIALRCPQLLVQSPATLRANAGEMILAFNLTPEKYRDLAKQAPHVFLVRKSKGLIQNVKAVAKVLNLDPEQTLKLLLKQPTFLGLTAARIRSNMKTTAKLLGVPEEAIHAVVIRRPNLLGYAPATIRANALGCAKAFGVTPEAFIRAALSNPHLFTVRPATLASKIPLVVTLVAALGLDWTPADTLAHLFDRLRLCHPPAGCSHHHGPPRHWPKEHQRASHARRREGCRTHAMKLRNPLSTLLQDAANRLYAEPVSLNTRLREAPTDTLYTLSTTPQEFGKLKWFDDTELFATALRRLLDCARAYITMEQKYAADASRQGKLPLPE